MSLATISSPGVADTAVETAVLLSLAGGFLDAFTYVGHGGVFANAMTGNVVLLAVRGSAGEWTQAFAHLPPIIAFLAGVIAAQALRLVARHRHRRAALISLVIEIAFLVPLSLLPRATPNLWIVLAVAFSAAVQNTSFTKIGAWSYNSVMTTGNLRHWAETMFMGLVPAPDAEALRQAHAFGLLCLGFLVGAAIGAVATLRLDNLALWIPIAILVGVFVRCRGWREAARAERSDQVRP